MNEFCHLYADDTIIVNTSKTEVIYFGKPNKVESCKNIEPVTFQGSKIESTDKVKYLGVTFDEDMTWENQSNQARSKAYFNLIKIKKILSFIDDSTKQLLLNALVFPHISYCLSSWSTANKKCTKKFDNLIQSVDRVFPMVKTFSSMANYQRSIIAFKGILP